MPYARAADGARLHYEAFGRRSSPAVLMIQGLGADKHGWDMQRFTLARTYRVIAFDNRGAGRSDKPFGVYSIEQMADDAVTVLDHAGVEAAHIVGASMGGRAPSGTGAVTDVGVHGVPQPAVATRTVAALDGDSPRTWDGRDDRRGSAVGDGTPFVPAPPPCVRLARSFGDGAPGTLVCSSGASDPGGR